MRQEPSRQSPSIVGTKSSGIPGREAGAETDYRRKNGEKNQGNFT
jgi:hypothetical protein